MGTEAWTGEDKGVKSAKNREFPAVWAEIFEAANAPRGGVPNLSFLPSAIGGDQTQHLLKRIQGCALANPALQPRVVVIAIGTNNIGAGCTSLRCKNRALRPHSALSTRTRRCAERKTRQLLHQASVAGECSYETPGRQTGISN